VQEARYHSNILVEHCQLHQFLPNILSLSGFFLPNALCILWAALLSRQLPGMLPSSICFASLAKSSALFIIYLNLFCGSLLFSIPSQNCRFLYSSAKNDFMGL
jgi:hypothetical protein